MSRSNEAVARAARELDWHTIASQTPRPLEELDWGRFFSHLRDEDGDLCLTVVNVPFATMLHAQQLGYLRGVHLASDEEELPYTMGTLVVGDFRVVVASESFGSPTLGDGSTGPLGPFGGLDHEDE